MDSYTREPLTPIHIASPCKESWSEMEGNKSRRFCRHCEHNVRNSESMTEAELTEATSSRDRVCLRLTVHPSKGILTCEGWVPRLVTIGIAAAVISGCSKEIIGETAAPNLPQSQKGSTEAELVGKVALEPTHLLGTPAPRKEL